MRHFAAAHLGRVSVVMMARVNSAKELAVRWRARTRRGIAFTIFCQRSGTPMTPVEHTRICEGCRRPEFARELQRGGGRGGKAFRAGAAIGVAGIDDHAAHAMRRLPQMQLRGDHGRGLHAIGGEDGGG